MEAEFFSFENTSTVLNDSKKLFFPASSEKFQALLTVLVSISCLLSATGSFLIILTYALFKKLRTLARHTLVCLSIADLLVALSAFLGIITPLSSLVGYSPDAQGAVVKDSALGNWCKTQAVVQVFSTQSSILWTIGVAVFMFALVVVQPKFRQWGIKLIVILHIVCWGIPFTLTLWLLLDGFLWFDLGTTPGFCAIVAVSTHENFTDGLEHEHLSYPIIVGYELWLYIAFIVLPILYISLSCYLRRKSDHMATLHLKATKQDVKLIFVPLIFLILRLWSVIVDISSYYLSYQDRAKFRQSFASPVFIMLEGIGDTAQGAVNGVLFCLFTQAIRIKTFQALRRICCQHKKQSVIAEESECQDEKVVENNFTTKLSAYEHTQPLLESSQSFLPHYS